ncbi:MAG: hypothetical protein V1735_03545 [Nanoarchaeota archaeon]
MIPLILLLLLLAGCGPTGLVIGESCRADEFFQIVTIDGKAQACYADNEVKVVLENGPEQDIGMVYVVVQGDGGSLDSNQLVNLDKGFATTVRMPYDASLATPRNIAVVPIINGRECAENTRTAPLRPCP